MECTRPFCLKRAETYVAVLFAHQFQKKLPLKQGCGIRYSKLKFTVATDGTQCHMSVDCC